jgi:UDP-N-acetylglucosamine acyltransferase
MALAPALIHPTAVVDAEARLAEDVVVGPYCVIGPNVSIGAGTRLVSHVHIDGHTSLGPANRVFPFASLGTEPQDLKYRGEPSRLEIGAHNTIRECVTINLGTEVGGGVTRVGDHNLLMACTHVAHDCVLEDHVVMANGALLGGHIHVASHAVVSGGALLHHFVSVGRHAFVAGGAHVNTDVPPFMISHGFRLRALTVNTVGLRRHGFSTAVIDALREAQRLVWRSGLARPDAIRRLERDLADVAEVQELAAFLRRSLEGKNGRAREATRRDE